MPSPLPEARVGQTFVPLHNYSRESAAAPFAELLLFANYFERSPS